MAIRPLLPYLTVFSGGVITLYAAADFVGSALPYPDPTPELLMQQQASMATAKVWMVIGAAWTAVGILLLVRRWLSARRSAALGAVPQGPDDTPSLKEHRP